jgi:hypothetical protein
VLTLLATWMVAWASTASVVSRPRDLGGLESTVCDADDHDRGLDASPKCGAPLESPRFAPLRAFTRLVCFTARPPARPPCSALSVGPRAPPCLS